MPKRRMMESRFDFSGGLNTRVSPDRLQANELVRADNARLSDRYGAIVKRTGSRRLSEAVLANGDPVDGVFQWDAPGGKQLVAIGDGNIYYRTGSDFGSFNSIIPATAFSTSTPPTFATGRENTSGAPLRLYIADGNLYRWTGSALTLLTGTSSAPGADLIALYHLRLFARDTDFPQSPLWSVLGDPEDFTAGLGVEGGQAMVDVLRGEGLTAMTVVGSSLLLATSDSIVRFTGYSSDDIQIAQDTEGVSAEVGAVGPLALRQIEGFSAMLSDRGPYIVTEAEAQAIGMQIEPEFDALDRSALADACIGYHSGRREIWFAVQGPDDTGNQTVYVLSMGGVQAWSGPFSYPFAIHCLASYEDSNGDEFIMAGCDDGYARILDSGSLDDILYDASGGSSYTMTVELAPVFFDSGPGMVKTLERIFLQAEIPLGKTIQLRLLFDDKEAEICYVEGIGGGAQDYRIDCHAQGRRLRVQIVDDTDDISVIHGVLLQAFDMQRPG